MWISHDLAAQRGRTNLRSPVLTERDEELLVAGKPILFRRSFATERRVIAVVRRGNSRDIRNVFGQRLLAIHVDIRERHIGVVLGGQLRRGCIEMRQVRWSPPIAQAARRVKGAAFCVEGVTDFMSND